MASWSAEIAVCVCVCVLNQWFHAVKKATCILQSWPTQSDTPGDHAAESGIHKPLLKLVVDSQPFCCCVMTLWGVLKASHVVFTSVVNLVSWLWLTVTCAQTVCDLINHSTAAQAAGFILFLCFLSLVLLVLSHQAVRILHKMSWAVRMCGVGHY